MPVLAINRLRQRESLREEWSTFRWDGEASPIDYRLRLQRLNHRLADYAVHYTVDEIIDTYHQGMPLAWRQAWDNMPIITGDSYNRYTSLHAFERYVRGPEVEASVPALHFFAKIDLNVQYPPFIDEVPSDLLEVPYLLPPAVINWCPRCFGPIPPLFLNTGFNNIGHNVYLASNASNTASSTAVVPMQMIPPQEPVAGPPVYGNGYYHRALIEADSIPGEQHRESERNVEL